MANIFANPLYQAAVAARRMQPVPRMEEPLPEEQPEEPQLPQNPLAQAAQAQQAESPTTPPPTWGSRAISTLAAGGNLLDEP